MNTPFLGNGMALFSAQTTSNDAELWITDGTTAGTSLVKNINAVPLGDGLSSPNFTLLSDTANVAPALTDVPAILVNGAKNISYTINYRDLLTGYTDADADTLRAINLIASSGSLVNNNDGTYRLTPLDVLVKNNDGTFTLTPDNNFTGGITLNYDVSDGNGGVTAASNTINVSNTAPSLTSAAVALADGAKNVTYALYASSLLTGYTDANGDTLSAINLVASSGSLVNNNDGTYILTPVNGFTGAVTLNYSVNDGTDSVAASTTLSFGNAVPSFSTLANGVKSQAYTFNMSSLLIGYNDLDGDTLSVTNVVASSGNLVNNNDGTYTLTPVTGFAGTVTLNYNVSDGISSLSGTNSIRFRNTAPSLTGVVATLANGTINLDYTFNASDLLVGYTDANNDVLSVTNLTSSSGSLVNNNDGTYTLTPVNGFTGTVTLNYNVSDGSSTIVAANSLEFGNRITVNSSVSSTLGASQQDLTLTGSDDINGTGNDFDNLLIGNSGNNILDGALGADTLSGGLGNDTYIVDNVGDVVVEDANAGNDTVQASVSYSLALNVENLTLTGAENLEATGNTLNNVLTGNSGSNTLIGGAGNDTLDGGLGADTLDGGAGDDTYYVDNIGDNVINEQLNGGTDSIFSSVNYSLSGRYVENLSLIGTSDLTATGNTLNNVLTGNSGNNTLTGSSGNDTLDGGLGEDVLDGGVGDDVYYVDNIGDNVINESLTGGMDSIFSSVNYSLSGRYVENLTLTGTSDLTATGNTLNNVLTGNSGNNTLTGSSGNDTLDGGLGADVLDGGTGDDVYYVDNIGDNVTNESLTGGMDSIFSSVSYSLSGRYVENLSLTGTSDLTATGNSLNNVLTGNSGNNTLIGGAGNDTYIFGLDSGQDVVTDTFGATDVLSVLSGVAREQLWFTHSGNNLEVSIIGTTDKVTISNWYVGGASNYNQVEEVHTASGNVLLSSQVESLVSAMSSFSPPSVGTTTLDSGTYASVLSAITTSWSS